MIFCFIILLLVDRVLIVLIFFSYCFHFFSTRSGKDQCTKRDSSTTSDVEFEAFLFPIESPSIKNIVKKVEEVEAEDDEEDKGVPEEEDTNENPETSDAEPSPYRYPQHGIATALKVKVKGKDPMIIPIDCVGDILCDKHRKPGFCFCKLRNLGYPIPEDTSQIEGVTTVRVSTKVIVSHYDGYRVIITELPETIPDAQ